MVRMDRIVEVNRPDRYVVVEPGVINSTLKAAVAAEGLHYPPDPASQAFCTIGGNVATNAGGLCCVKYGVTRDYVLGLEVVLADGTVARLGRRTVKGVAGLDLTGLVVGSEGTLGLVTGATLRLRRPPRSATTVLAGFSHMRALGGALAELADAAWTPSLLEVMDRTTVGAVESWRGLGLDDALAGLLICQVEREEMVEGVLAADLERRLVDAGADLVWVATDDLEASALLDARRLAYPALERLGEAMLDDVAVPPSRVLDLITGVEQIGARYQVTIGVFGHAGEGNLYPTLITPRGDEVARARAAEAFDAILSLALRLGGTLTGEHGVGLLKQHRLGSELDAGSISLHRRVKRAMDPLGILNPGKGLPDDEDMPRSRTMRGLLLPGAPPPGEPGRSPREAGRPVPTTRSER